MQTSQEYEAIIDSLDSEIEQLQILVENLKADLKDANELIQDLGWQVDNARFEVMMKDYY